MLWFTVLAVWYACDCTLAVPAVDKPFYSAADHAHLFKEFKVTYNKQYATPQEERQRFEIFKSNLNDINQLNAKYKETVYGINQFSDLTTKEAITQYTGLSNDESSEPELESSPSLPTNFSSFEVTESFDWRDKNVITRVRNQGICKSSWAFATMGSFESNYARKSNKLREFAVRALVDCGAGFMYNCAHGGLVETCKYLQDKGAMLEKDYPYVDKFMENCTYNKDKVVAHAGGCILHAGKSEEELKNILFTSGPFAIIIDPTNMIKYDHGILMDCSYDSLTYHALVVGYGVDDGLPYWTLKLSWGARFGEKGYLRMYRGMGCLGFNSVNSTIITVEAK